ncbi:MAG: hypothetical protein NC090_06165 [Anaeroplasma bactoclasticum]|nr:hypothetical protein [Anaeroplasma bactoclasticum]
MKITEKAKQTFLKLLEDNGSDTLEIQIASSSCCGNKSIRLNLVNESDCARVVQYDGLKVAISDEEEKELEKVTFNIENGQIVIQTNII